MSVREASGLSAQHDVRVVSDRDGLAAAILAGMGTLDLTDG
jgi:hypothetical protein